MNRVRVIYHDEPPYGWWAESPDIDGWTAVAGTFDQIRQLVEEGVRFALERDDVIVEHLLPASAA